MAVSQSSPEPSHAEAEIRPARGGDAPEWLTGLWYLALPAGAVKPGRFVARSLLGQPVLIGRTAAGDPFALRDICPHRGIPLSSGRFDGREVECCYHGWRFDPSGRCTAIPSLVDDQAFAVERIRVRRYPLVEGHGLLWIFMGDTDSAPPPPTVPALAGLPLRHVETAIFPCPLDDAVVGLMDPAHGPFVHRSWWWRSRRSIHAKAKQFAPSANGFTMVRHAPSRNSFAYRLLGGRPETEIRFELPALRVEDVTAGRHRLVGLTAITPLDRSTCAVTQAMYWTMPWLTLARPVLRPFIRRFLDQDRAVVAAQQAGLAHSPSLMLIDDADTQAKWYFRLKREFAAAAAAERPFVNPLKPRVLRWKS